MRAAKTEPIALEIADAGPAHDDLARLARGEGEPLVLAERYRLVRRLGSGGMGAVFLAEQLDRANRCVALKILDASARDWCRAIDRFLWEARLATRIRHPNVVEAHDYGSTPNGIVFMVMELLEGRDLRAIVRENGGLSWRWTRYVMRQVCAGLNALHRIGVVHRDLKASNCFYIRRSGAIKIIDLGIATFEDPMVTAPGEEERSVVGTPEYMAPEQIRGAPVDRRADVYAAGVLLFELLTGRVPFCGRTTEAVFEQQLCQPPPALGELAPWVAAPEHVDAVLRKALAKRPSERYSNALDLADALEQLGEPSVRRRVVANTDGWASSSFEDAPTRRRSPR
ncbi:MAG TPA: serine/threonine-protein kinase [Enhygromyxa sp.]|nr:serine/threonine-protein kinase [Enhygromyxa sp.]